jgi:hypothetical protein
LIRYPGGDEARERVTRREQAADATYGRNKFENSLRHSTRIGPLAAALREMRG